MTDRIDLKRLKALLSTRAYRCDVVVASVLGGCFRRRPKHLTTQR